MSLWTTGSFLYVAVRSAAALGLLLFALLARGRGWPLAAQAGSDAVAALLLLAYTDYDLREIVRLFSVPLVAYVLAWEWLAMRERFSEWEQQDGDVSLTDFGGCVEGARWFWELLFVAPPVVAGGFLVFDLVFPGQWPFPNPPPALRCEPATLERGDTLRLRLRVPHGGELGVATPSGRFLYIVEFAPGGTPPERRFEWTERLDFAAIEVTGRPGPGRPAEPVFSDTGSYLFRVSEPAEISASLTCGVLYVGPPPTDTTVPLKRRAP